MPQGPNFREKIILVGAPAGAPKNLFLALGVLETSSFHCLLQNIPLIMEYTTFFVIGPSAGIWNPKHKLLKNPLVLGLKTYNLGSN